MERTLTRLKSNLNRNRRKLSLPMLIGPFQWNHGEVRAKAVHEVSEDHAKQCALQVEERRSESVVDEIPRADEEEADPPSDCPNDGAGKTWLSLGKSRAAKNRKPRRWPSTPAFVSLPTATKNRQLEQLPAQAVPTTSAAPSSSRPPQAAHIQGYNLTMPRSYRGHQRHDSGHPATESSASVFALKAARVRDADEELRYDVDKRRDSVFSPHDSTSAEESEKQTQSLPDRPDGSEVRPVSPGCGGGGGGGGKPCSKNLHPTIKELSSAYASPKDFGSDTSLLDRGIATPNLGFGRQVAVAVSLPAINCLSDADELEHHEEGVPAPKSVKRPEQRKGTKLKRRKAYYRHKTDGRSKSLTHIDALDSAMLAQRGEDGDSRSEPDTTVVTAGSQDRLVVPMISTQGAALGATGSYTLGPAGSDPAMRRRRLSNLYKIASSEYFSVSFDCLDDPGPEEFVAASKGTTLRESLSLVCERRGVDLNSVHVYLDSSKTPLSMTTTETFWLGGKHLRIKAKDEVKSPIRSLPAKPILQQQSSRKGSGSYRSGKNSRILSGAASTEDATSAGDAAASSSPASTNHSHGAVVNTSAASHEGSLKAKGAKTSTRWSGLFSSSYKDTKMDSLVEQLNEYSRHGIPRLPYLLSFEADEEDDNDEDGLYRLEDDWKQIVVDWGSLSERTRQQQNAIWELVQTELAYLRTLKVITDLFMACLCNLQAAQILNEIDTERLFSNIPEIYVANRQFWVENVVPMLKAARAARAPLDPAILKEAFVKFDELFHPYTKYCLEQTHCQQYCKEKDHDNELFKAYLAWCETQRDCNRLRLMDILVKPMQRLTKYSLLLKAIHKKTDDENHKASLIEMIQGVESFVGNVNSALRQRHEQERLREIISRIESYDAVEAKDEEIERLLKTHCDLDLTRPMPGCSEHQRRHLLTEGDLKLKDQVSSKADVHCFLFTDILLICKPVARKAERVKVIRPPFLVDRLVAIELAKDPAALGLVYLNELGTASAAFCLHAPEAKQSKAWLDNIRKAQELYREAKAAAAAAQADTLYFVGDEDDDMDFPASALLVARSPRGSSRGSRGSSLVHSHSGSVDMNDTSGAAAYGRGPSVEIGDVKRASSASSEDSTGASAATVAVQGVAGAAMKVSSPRPERRSMLGRPHHQSHSTSPTPNTLTVQVPHIIASHQGQSLPNLLSLSVPVPMNATSGLSSSSTSLLHTAKAPSSAMSQRGVSYPPPSPRGLTRTQPVPQSRNPPLVKTRRIVSTAGTTEASVIESLVEATNFHVEVPSGAPTKADDNGESNDACSETVHEADDELADQESDDLNRQLLNAALAKRLARNERIDNRRYHTAGAIEDIKKQDMKNSSIHKRLSWNYGHQTGSPPAGTPGTTTPGSSLCGSRVQLRSGMISAVNTDSMLSFSSSGVSSTGSLHLSTASEAEDTEAELDLKPHVSSTYIGGVEATNVQVRLYQDKASANVFQLTDPPSRPLPPPPPPRCLPVPPPPPPPVGPFNNDLRIDVSEVCDGISSVQITVSSADGAKPSRADLIRMKDLILSDASMEASEV